MLNTNVDSREFLANAFEKNMQQAKSCGMTGFITKSVNSAQLIETIRNICARQAE